MPSHSEIDQVLRQQTDAGEIPGVVAIAATADEVIYQGAYGKRDLSRDDAMTPDSVFWIASMTKAVTTAAGMQMVEQGKLSLDAPIGDVLPDLAAPQVLEGFDANGEPQLRLATKPITLRHLMTHTAGFAYDMWNGDVVRYLAKAGLPAITTCKNAALKTPLMSDPGTRWEYGTNIDFVGKAVEAASGQRLDTYLRDHMFAPLGMTDTVSSSATRSASAWSACIPVAKTDRRRRSRSRSSRIRNSTWAAAGSTAPPATTSSSRR